MAQFTDRLHQKGAKLWENLLGHPFLEETYRQEISDERFAQWVRQDYIFVRDAIPFISIVSAKAPVVLRAQLANIVGMLVKELGMFEEMAGKHGITLENIKPAPACHAYLQYLYATAHMCSLEESFTVLYAAEKAYYDSWKTVRDNLESESKWQTFIEYWSSDEFAAYVKWLETELDKLAEGMPEARLQAMEEQYLLTGRYEFMFWTMAQTNETWPV